MSLEETPRDAASSATESSLDSYRSPSSLTSHGAQHEGQPSGDSSNESRVIENELHATPKRALLGGGVPRETKLTLEDCVDMDVDVLTTVLERSFQSLKRETLDFFVEARTRFKTRALNELSHERLMTERREAAKNEELQLLEQQVQAEELRNERLTLSLSRTADAVGTAHLRKHSYRLLLTVYHAWIAFAHSERSLKHKMRKAVSYYCEDYLKRRSLVQWVEIVREQTRKCAREKFQAKLDVARTAMEAQFTERYAALEAENRDLKETLKMENEARSKLEEDMQQAFMRGVCALNMEALTVMKRGMPPNGVNPFFNLMENAPPTLDTTENKESDAEGA